MKFQELKYLDESQIKLRALNLGEMTAFCDPAIFAFQDTSELSASVTGMVGQDRAIRSMDFGLSIDAAGYNLFLVGPTGTGKTTYANAVVRQLAQKKEPVHDWCYVYNFEDPDRPVALSFEAGKGCRFRDAMSRLVTDVEQELRRVFQEESYHQQRNKLLSSYEEQADRVWKMLETTARQQGFSLQRTPTGWITVPLKRNGQLYTPEEYANLPELEKAIFREKERTLNDMVQDTLRQVFAIQREAKEKLEKFNEETALFAISQLFDEMKKQFPDVKVGSYLENVKKDVIQHFEEFIQHDSDQEDSGPTKGLFPFTKWVDPKARYQVNLVVDHQAAEGAPLVVEANPTYYNLFGKIEYRGTFGSMVTDFTMVRSGAMQRANGGYILLQALDVLTSPMSWQALKRSLKMGELRIENLAEDHSLIPTTGLRPEPIPLKIKVILIGTPEIYQFLYQMDEDFRKLFKVKVDFDDVMQRDEVHQHQFAEFVASVAEQEQLLPFTREAVAEIINFSMHEAGQWDKLSTRFYKVTEVLVEANFFATARGSRRVEQQDIHKALKEKEYRSNQVEEKVLELFQSDILMVETRGTRVGQINGLAVVTSGDFAFGQPTRISVRTYAGKNGVVNVERESALSGRLHDKGVMILSGYLAAEFAQSEPLAMSATIVFEQSYYLIDGDSASSTELYALLSSLSGIPISQEIAVTGSVNQFGEIQPIGGVNEKIKGFFKVCQTDGLTGNQGVIIPAINISHLFLDEEVREAVAAGKFHIWPVRTVKEGVEILTGVKAGSPDEEGTVYYRVAQRLKEMSRQSRPRENSQRRNLRRFP